jgi:AraC-like DNA-binding protein
VKKIEHSYGADLTWVEEFAKQLEGKIEGNFITVPENLQTGTRYYLDCGEGIVAYYINVQYNKNFHLVQKNTKDDFIGLYYNLTDGEASVVNNNVASSVGRWKYNLAIIDSTLETDYHVKTGTGTYALCIFIKKNMITAFAKKNNVFFPDLNKITDPAKNTVIRFDRMSNESYHLLNDLRKLKVGGPVFDLNLTATVHMLISNYLKKLSRNRIVIQKVNESDLKNIIEMQMLLINNVENHFPTITHMAKEANMSESKFKDLFKKITGSTPNAFFMDNKLNLAKELLETKQLSISQISDRLNFTNNSYFASRFKEHFGISPRTFIQQL